MAPYAKGREVPVGLCGLTDTIVLLRIDLHVQWGII
jgi:hypothetical protein